VAFFWDRINSYFEDAVVASIVAKAGCELIVTRNVADFKRSPVTALLPEEFLERLGWG